MQGINMNRRSFVNKSIATLAGFGLAGFARAEEKKVFSPVRNATWFTRPYQIFKLVEMETKGYPDWYSLPMSNGESLLGRMYVTGETGFTQQEADERYYAKLDDEAGRLLLASADADVSPVIKENELNKFFGTDNIGFVKWGGKTIAVNLDCRDYFVMPTCLDVIRGHETKLGHPYYYHCISIHGLAILSRKVVVIVHDSTSPAESQ